MDDVGDCVVMASSWLLPSKVAVVEPGSFVDPTTITGSPCLTSLSLFLFLHLVLGLFTSSPFCSACSFESVISPRFSLFRPSLGVFVPSFLRLLVAPLILSLDRTWKGAHEETTKFVIPRLRSSLRSLSYIFHSINDICAHSNIVVVL